MWGDFRMCRYLVVLTVLFLWAGNALALSGGGTEGDPWLIQSLADFDAFAGDPNYWDWGDYISLEVDIDLLGRTYTTAVIAPDTDSSSDFQGTPFMGVFEGNGHAIYNLGIEGGDYLGLFGRIEGASAEVNDLHLENINITGGLHSRNLGGLCGYNLEGTISNCNATGSVTGEGDSGNLGALCGGNYSGTITNCFSSGSVTGGLISEFLGGLCGENYNGTIINCHSNASVTGGTMASSMGGLCGKNYNGAITNCDSSGSVTGGDSASHQGGLCGENWLGIINNCHATGSVIGDAGTFDLGGLCGYSKTGTITNCYATGLVRGYKGSQEIGGFCGNKWEGTIDNCYSTGNVSAKYSPIDFAVVENLGGFCGITNYGTISNCYSTGSVSGSRLSKNFGGFCGRNGSLIINCYATGSVTCASMSEYSGGLCGWNYGPVTNCYSTGSVTGDDYVGALCGRNYDNPILYCFWDVETSGIGIAGDDNYGATGKTTLQMQTGTTFTDAGWDFDPDDGDVADWWINEARDYPKLGFQPFGDVNNDSHVNLVDSSIMTSSWLATSGDANFNSVCELSGDTTINIADLEVLSQQWLIGPLWP